MSNSVTTYDITADLNTEGIPLGVSVVNVTNITGEMEVIGVPGSPGQLVGNAGGDLGGTYPNPQLQPTANVLSIIAANAPVSSVAGKTGVVTLVENDIANLAADLAAKLALAGGTMTGPIVLAADPTTNLQAATKQYVDSTAAGGTPNATFKTSGKVKQTVYNVRDYGAVGDTQEVTDGTMTAGSHTLTSGSTLFVSGDIGKQISINNVMARSSGIGAIINSSTNTLTIGAFISADVGSSITVAGAGTAGGNLTTTIASINTFGSGSANTVTLATPAITTVSNAVVTFGSLTFVGKMTAGFSTLTITTVFVGVQAMDKGTPILITGAGPGGTDLLTTISSVVDGNDLVIATNASTSVRNTTIKFGIKTVGGTITALNASNSVSLSITPDWSVSNATFYWGTDDSAALQSCANDITSGGLFYVPWGKYFSNAKISLLDDTVVQGGGKKNTQFITAMTVTNEDGIFTISNKTGIEIHSVQFIIGGNAAAITSYGHDGLLINDCLVTGTTQCFGAIELAGYNGVATMQNTTIRDCKFFNICTSALRVIDIAPRTGYQTLNTLITGNRFKSCYGPAVFLNVFTEVCKDTLITDNKFDDLISGTIFNMPAVGVFGGISQPYLLFNTTITGNQYRNTLTNNIGLGQGFAWIYQSIGTVITGNNCVGAWTNATPQAGPCFAPGRVGDPDIGMVISDNYVRGFDSPIDFDACKNTEVSDNVVEWCGNGIILGYNVQENVNIHDNINYNSVLSSHYGGMATNFANSNPKKCKFKDNTFIDDRSIPAPTLVSANPNALQGILNIGTTYYYVITALDTFGETIASNELSGTPTSGNQSIQLKFTYVVGAASYNIYRSTTSGTYGPTSLLQNLVPQNNNSSFTYDNILYDTGNTALTTGAPPVSPTVATAQMIGAIELTGSRNFIDVEVSGNRFYAPHVTLSTGNLFSYENGDEIAPRNAYFNEIEDATGIRLSAAPPAVGGSGQLQFNSSNNLNADGALSWDNNTKRLAVGASATFNQIIGTGYANTSVSTITIPITQNTSKYNTIIGVVKTGNVAPVSSITDTQGNTWFIDVGMGAAGQTVNIIRCNIVNPLTTSDSVTINFPANAFVNVILAEYNGNLTTLDVASESNPSSGTSATITAPVATRNVKEIVIAAIGFGGSSGQASISVSAGTPSLTLRSQGPGAFNVSALADGTSSSSVTPSASWSWSSTQFARLVLQTYIVQTPIPTAMLDAGASTTSNASVRIRAGTAPSSPNSGDLWFDGSHLQFRNGSTTDQLDNQESTAISRSINSVSTPTNAGSAAYTDYVYLVSGTTTITLPTAVGNTNKYTIKNSGSNTVSIATTSSQTIDGSSSPITLPVANTSLDLISDGSNWRII